MNDRLDMVVDFYEGLSPETVSDLRDIYSDDAHFRDPFNDVRGHDAIERIFEHMFVQVRDPRFRVISRVCSGGEALLEWVFTFTLGNRAFEIQGATALSFDAHGRVVRHRDYWDVAEELYEKLPVLGVLMRWLHRRMSAAHPPG